MVPTAFETEVKCISNVILQQFCPFLWKAAQGCLVCSEGWVWAVSGHGEPSGCLKQQSKRGGKWHWLFLQQFVLSTGWKLLELEMVFSSQRAPIVLPTYGA